MANKRSTLTPENCRAPMAMDIQDVVLNVPGITSVEVTGEGNAVTDAAIDVAGRKLTLTRGATYETAADVDSKISAKVGAIEGTVKEYIDDKTSDIASGEDLTALGKRVTTAEDKIAALEESEDDIFWVTTKVTEEDEPEDEVPIDKTAEEIFDAYKSGKTIFWNVIGLQSDDENEIVNKVTLRQSQILDYSNNSGIILIFFNANSFGLDSDYSALAGIIVLNIHDNKMQANIDSSNVGILTEQLPVESNLNGAAREGYGLDTYAAYYDHVHPAPFPNWTKSIGKALFVNNDNTTPSKAFEWRDVPNGDFTSKVGDFLRVAAVDSNNKPTKWTTDSIANAKGENF